MSDPIEDGIPAASGNDIAFAFQLLQHASQHALASVSHAACEPGNLARWIQQNASSVVGNALPTDAQCEDDLGMLRWLLDEIERPTYAAQRSQDRNATPRADLTDAIHRAIGLLSCDHSFSRAVELSAKRQVYNLAYGLTHEINNPLGNIVARAQQMISTASTDSDRKSLATIVDQAMRAHEMLAEVMRAVQPSPLHLEVEDVNAVVRSVWTSLLQQAEVDSIRWQAEMGHEPMYARIDAPSLTEVLRLIGRNALEVCRPNDSVIWSCEIVPQSAGTHANKDAMGCIRISVRDTGPGLSPSGMRSAMDLFFSGREQGRGLGVSLAVVRRIVEAHAGIVTMHSEPNAGCSVVIELPRVNPPARKRPHLQL